ncbi:hypothetical protein CLI81_06850 [Porphyromonas gingivalis]|nr:hypothetical protein CLI81_06850 [Porphyromonas gingivalis]
MKVLRLSFSQKNLWPKSFYREHRGNEVAVLDHIPNDTWGVDRIGLLPLEERFLSRFGLPYENYSKQSLAGLRCFIYLCAAMQS